MNIQSDKSPQSGRVGAPGHESMQTPENFEVRDGYSYYQLLGHGSLTEAASKVIEGIAFSRKQGVRNLLIDTTKWTGHASPSTLERFSWASAFSKVAGEWLKLALVVRPELMDPDKFEVTVATNRGMNGNVFDSEKDALDWLLDQNG
jgi:hypothetical protein